VAREGTSLQHSRRESELADEREEAAMGEASPVEAPPLSPAVRGVSNVTFRWCLTSRPGSDKHSSRRWRIRYNRCIADRHPTMEAEEGLLEFGEHLQWL
jgi:hypothetical protein